MKLHIMHGPECVSLVKTQLRGAIYFMLGASASWMRLEDGVLSLSLEYKPYLITEGNGNQIWIWGHETTKPSMERQLWPVVTVKTEELAEVKR